MAFARDVYTATSSQTDFTISFTYLKEAHIVVTQNGTTLVNPDDYTLPNATTVRLVTGATTGDTVVVYRSTSQSTRLTDYTAGVLTEADLDNDSFQAFYMAQEAIDQVNLGLKKDSSELWDATSIRIINLATPSASTDAVTKAYVDAISAAAGSVPTPGNPGEDDYLLVASAGSFAWTSPSASRTALGLGALALLATVDTAQIDDNAVSLAKIAGGTAGDVLYWNGSGDPAALAVGSNGEVLTLAAGVPSWAALTNPDVEFVDSGTASTSASLDFTGLDSGYDHIFVIDTLAAANDGVALHILTSTDNGSNYDTGASDYGYLVITSTSGAVSPSGNTAAFCRMTALDWGNASGEAFSGIAEVINPSNASVNTQMQWRGRYRNTAGTGIMASGTGERAAAEDVDAIRFIASTGNLSSGSIYHFRRKLS